MTSLNWIELVYCLFKFKSVLLVLLLREMNVHNPGHNDKVPNSRAAIVNLHEPRHMCTSECPLSQAKLKNRNIKLIQLKDTTPFASSGTLQEFSYSKSSELVTSLCRDVCFAFAYSNRKHHYAWTPALYSHTTIRSKFKDDLAKAGK